MSDMLDDINKFAKIWDSALEKGIFDDAPKVKEKQPDSEEEGWGSDFFGQNFGSEEDMTINESQAKYWVACSGITDLVTEQDKTEVPDAMAKAHNPVYPNTVGKDQEMKVSQNWAVGGKEHFDLEELKINLEKLESKLNSLDAEGKSSDSIQNQIDDLRKKIDNLSDLLSGSRSSEKDND